MRILVTGAAGFVGPHLAAALKTQFGSEISIVATSQYAADHAELGQVRALDVTDKAATRAIIKEVVPTHVVHLAGLAAIQAANANADLAWQVHVFGTLNVANALLDHAPDCALIAIGSGQVYGASARAGLPLDEATLLIPTNCYEVTKAAADLGLGAMTGRGLRSIRLRPFNHTGPGQTGDFVVPNLAMQIARIEAGLAPPVVRAGNLEAERDFLDVRDVTAAYALAVARSHDLPAGTILNIASGIPRRIRDLLDRLLALANVPITVEVDPARMRSSDTARFVGDASQARRLLGWTPVHDIDATLASVLDDCRRRVSSAR